jgi:hypothetical protein
MQQLEDIGWAIVVGIVLEDLTLTSSASITEKIRRITAGGRL